MIERRKRWLLCVGLAFFLTGCTVHPAGEREERQAALHNGAAFTQPVEKRQLPPLSPDPSPEDLVRYALASNADIEQRYWEWRSAIEQIPQDGTQATNLTISAGTTISKGQLSSDRTTLAALNDPMADIVWPTKLSVASQRALENARAAGLRFAQAKFDLRAKVLDAWYAYALNAELIRIEQSNAELLATGVLVVEARNRAGAAGQQDLLKASNELDLSRNDLANMQAQLPALLSALNALLGRPPEVALAAPAALPTTRPISESNGKLLAMAQRENPELKAMAAEIRGRGSSIELAKLQYVPDFSLSAGTDLAGLTQSLLGSVTVPFLRHEAIDAAIAQAEANLHSTEAARRQTQNDLGARFVGDISALRDADRQLALFDQVILPRLARMVELSRSAYESGQSSLLDLLDSQRSLLSVRRLVAELRVAREKRLADLESILARPLDASD
ncbi:MAG TPA: TolC family protein [Tepidisphaeraceae bacterium]|nr:TolC family protein [Tepidisphaeraceae bacterium]